MPWLELTHTRDVSTPSSPTIVVRAQLTKMREATIYNPSVASNDNTMSLKIAFLNISLSCNVVPAAFAASATLLRPLNASKNAAAYTPRENSALIRI